ncbi:MAG: hypothetical protein A4E37_00352 [Methanoregulaceae archaeon PtaB.Bin056]|jgi:hypothetical protein|nr:MAG: hypothetical protein A4E37_00352 [Methanoregulaceae archaeon PtaB.Bin056]
MALYYGCQPAVPTRQAVENFENDVTIRHRYQVLVSKVYLDMQAYSWAVPVAYNLSRQAGLKGDENSLEVRYSYVPGERELVNVFRSDIDAIMAREAWPFADPDSFIQYAVKCERSTVNPAT